MLQIDKLAAQLARVDQTLENATTLQSTTRDVIVHLQETLQTTVAPLTAIKDNLEHLHQKLDSLENTLDERLPSGTDFLGHGHINDRTAGVLTLMVLMMQIPHGQPLMIVKPLIQMMMPQRLPLLLV
jgi:ABC-type transporter Mla subunit MlaD